MNKLISEIKKHLSNPKCTVKVEIGSVKLSKKTGTPRYSFFLKDIERIFGSVEDFISEIKKDGKKTTFTFRIYYEKSGSYIFIKKINKNFKEKRVMNQNNIRGNALGAPSVDQGFLAAYVGASSVPDLKEKIAELKSELKEVKSENKNILLENRQLIIKIDTVEARSELAIARSESEKKSITENPLLMKLAGMIVPKMMDTLTPVKPIATALAGANLNLTPEKKQLVDIITSSDDSVAIFLLNALKKQQAN